jgi:hypothetical protein
LENMTMRRDATSRALVILTAVTILLAPLGAGSVARAQDAGVTRRLVADELVAPRPPRTAP